MYSKGIIGSYRYRAVLLDPVHGFIPVNIAEYELMQTPFLRRLHNISQLGLTFLVYPGARHTRFEHSIGVMHLMGKFADKLTRILQEDQDICLYLTETCSMRELRNFTQTARFAGLLHDLGHLPFSHQLEIAFDEISRRKPELFKWRQDVDRKIHELYTRFFIRYLKDNYAKPKQKLRTFLQAVEDVLFSKARPDKEAMKKLGLRQGAYEVLNQLISGTIDTDRLDYVLRDSHHAGVVFGRVDVERLIYALTLDLDKNRPRAMYDIRGLSALEDMFDSRVKMYKWLYYHHKNTSFYITLTKIVNLIFENWEEIRNNLYPHLGEIDVASFIDPERMAEFIGTSKVFFDENEFMTAVMILRKTGGKLAERWASSIMERRDLLPVSIIKRSGDLTLHLDGKPQDIARKLSRSLGSPEFLSYLRDTLKEEYSVAFGEELIETCGLTKPLAEFVISTYSIERGALKRDLKVKGLRVLELSGISSHVRGIHVAASDPIIYVHVFSDDECEHLFIRRNVESMRTLVLRVFEREILSKVESK